MVMYRLGRWAIDGPVYRKPVLWLARALHVFVRRSTASSSIRTPISDDVLSSAGKVQLLFINTAPSETTAAFETGRNVSGAADFFDRQLAPVIGNNVRIDVGAVIMGKVSIGNNVLIDANALVGTDVPDNSKVLAPASRVISWGVNK